MEPQTLITPSKRKKLERDEKVYNDYNELMAEPGAMSTAVTDFIMELHGIASRSTVWQIVKRVREKKEELEKVVS